MKTLFIAEKPDIARAIAGHLFPDGYTKTKHYYEKGDTTVTWAFGHILRMAEPADTRFSPRTGRCSLWRSARNSSTPSESS